MVETRRCRVADRRPERALVVLVDAEFVAHAVDAAAAVARDDAKGLAALGGEAAAPQLDLADALF